MHLVPPIADPALPRTRISSKSTEMKSICVFCGSSLGNDPKISEAARALGRSMAQQGTTLVYGGAKIGIMGVVADAVLENGGKVIGVIPKFLGDKEIAHSGLTELILCETMHERKTKMFELSEGFIALPGGFGTLEEVIEILTWQQLGLHHHPVGILNVGGFYQSLGQLFDQMESTGFLKPDHKDMALFADSVEALLSKMRAYKPHETGQWITKSVT